MPSAIPPPSQAANTTSPRDILLGFQFRRENRALLDAFEEERARTVAQAEALAEAQRLREQELERKIQLVEQQHKEMEGLMNERLRKMGEHVMEHDGEIRTVRESVRKTERSVVETSSTMLPSRTCANAMANAKEDEEQQTPRSSPPVLPSVHRAEVRRLLQQSQPQSAPAAPTAVVPPPQRYALRRSANADAAAARPSSAPNTTANSKTKGKESIGTRANLSRKRSIAGAPTTPATGTTATPVTGPVTRERSASTSSTLSTAPSSHADEPVVPEPVIPALPFNRRGLPHQADLEVDIYFAAAKKFARERRVHLEGEEEQNKFILQIFKGMKKEERTEIVCALEKVTLAKMNPERTTVQFLGLWREIEAGVDKTVLAEAKAKANLLRATAMMVER